MKILIISHEYPPVGGGGANACYNLAKEYVVQGHKVHVVSVWFEGCEEIDTQGELKVFRIRSPRKDVHHSSFFEMMSFLLKADGLCRKLEVENKYDICHTFFAIPSGPIAYRLRRKYNLPYVIRFGGGDIPGAQKRYMLLYKFLSPVEHLIWRKATALVANSEGLRQRALAFDDHKNIEIIPNGVRIPDALCDGGAESRFPKTEGKIRLLFVSRLIEGKGLQDIFPYMRELSAKCELINKKLKYTIVGDGPYRDAYETMAKDLQLDDIVEFVGYKSRDELVGYYRQADIFVFPSRSEGMPNVVLEAMSYGLPIVMTPCEGSMELIKSNGYVVPADEFLGKIWFLITDDATRHRFSAESYRIAKEEFSWEKAAKDYLRIFSEND